MRRHLGSGLVIVALVAVALSGCGGSNDDTGSSDGTTTSGASSSLDGWAQGFCTSVAAWERSVKKTGTQLSNSQADFASASEAITSANEVLIESLQGLSAPPAPATTEAKDVIDELSADLEDGAGEIDQALTGNFTTQSEINSAASQARTSLSKMNRDISTAVTKLRALPDEEGWKQAFTEVPSCHAVANG